MSRWRWLAAGAAAAGFVIGTEVRLARPSQPVGPAGKRELLVEPSGPTALGLSFRPQQAEAMGLDHQAALTRLLTYPFDCLRLAAYWDRQESSAGAFDPTELDRQLDAAESAGKRVILSLGAIKNFGYPEFFVPAHRLAQPFPEGSLVTSASHPELLSAACSHLTRLVERYRDRESVIAWQVEHEAVDPLGMEHSWRLSADFVEKEVATVRREDPGRPILMNGFLPTSTPVRLTQWLRTLGQGDSLALAERLADIIGLDYYPCHALATLGPVSVYLDGDGAPWQRLRWHRLLGEAAAQGRRLMISEGQAEPWEAVTVPPDPAGRVMYSCGPQRLIANYNRCLRQARQASCTLEAYLFWGAEYWLLRERGGDRSYLDAFTRILEAS